MNALPIVTAPADRGQPNAGAGETKSADSSSSVAKVFASLQARLALRGFVLQALPGGRFAVSSWNLHKVLDDLADVEAFAQQVGA
jgi:hypothetical protein